MRYILCIRCVHILYLGRCSVAGVGWLSGTAAESLRAFGERVFANFRDKNVVFYNCGETGHFWLSKDLHTHRHVPSNTLFDVLICTLVMYWLSKDLHTHTLTQTRSLKHPFRCLDMHFYFTMQICSFKRPFRCLDIHFYLSMWQSKSNWFLPF